MLVSRAPLVIASVVLLFHAGPPAVAENATVAPAVVSLSFGQVFAGALPGSVRVSATGFRTTSGATYAGNGLRGSAARFFVKTPGAKSWSVMLPMSATLSSGGSEMTIDGFEYNWGPAAGPDSESRALTVGATLHVGARQPSSEYAGTFALTLVYD